MKRLIAAGIALTFVIVVTAGAAFFLGTRYAQGNLSIKRVTATDLANAMKEDRFYADYGANSLLVSATISSLTTHTDDVVIGLKTDSSFQTLCDLGTDVPSHHVGDRVTVVAEGGSAQRQPSAVRLTGCTIP